MKTPASLLQRLRTAPDPQVWQRFVDLYLPLVCHWARQAGLQDSDVADLGQEVFTHLYLKLPDFIYDPGRSFRQWLRTVTLNKWRELHRRRAATLVGTGADLQDLASEDPAQQIWEHEHHHYLVTRALDLMHTDFDETTWRACWMTAVENRSGAEVAGTLGISVGAVHAAKSRVLRRLRQELAGLLDA